MPSKEQIKKELAAMGISGTDTVLIHTSLKAVGHVEGGPDALIDAFCEHLDQGLFLIPTHTWANVNRHQPIYDPTVSEPCIGLVPRTAAKRTDGVRSLHPTHSVWAKGVGAEEFVRGEDTAETPCPVGGVWCRLADVGAKILLIGVGLERNTFIHAVDEMAGLDRVTHAPWQVTVLAPNGQRHTHLFHNHEHAGSENFGNFEKALTERGAITRATLGNAPVMIVDAAKCRDILLDIYSRTTAHLCLIPHEIPEHLWR